MSGFVQRIDEVSVAAHSATALAHAARAARPVVRAQVEPPIDAVERQHLDELLETRDEVEGVRAWMERRAPRRDNR
ncbi:MAG TPA: hypothetical protein PLH72_12185 [Vicinamibacterales bacterium]|nr:hypothetical protein [Vicinamibacterales bacterium]